MNFASRCTATMVAIRVNEVIEIVTKRSKAFKITDFHITKFEKYIFVSHHQCKLIATGFFNWTEVVLITGMSGT